MTNTTKADFFLYNNETLTINSRQTDGYLFDSSIATLVNGADVHFLRAYNDSTASIFAGRVSLNMYSYDTAILNIKGGEIQYPYGYGSSTINITGGSMFLVRSEDLSSIHISGGFVKNIATYDTSTTTFSGRNFRGSGGLTISGNEVLGTGLLSGQWMDGSSFATEILYQSSGSTITIIPEPATLVIISFGILILRRIQNRY
jgi:hypothetical protein